MRSNFQARHDIPGQATLKLLRIPYVQEARGRSCFHIPRYSGGKGRCHPFHVPLKKTHPLCPSTEPVQSGNAPFTSVRLGESGSPPQSRLCRSYARGRAASGGALSMPSSTELVSRPPLASPPPRESSPGECKRASCCLNSGAPGFQSCHKREEGGGHTAATEHWVHN